MMKLINMIIISLTLIIPSIISIMSNNKFMHPMLMGIIMFITTMISSINLSLNFKNHWFSFLTFLILIGGMMILFLYFISFNNNMKMNMKWMFLMSIPLKSIFMFIFMFSIYLNFNKIMWIYNINDIKMSSFENKFNLNFMYLEKKNMPSMIAMLYLLLTLSMIVKLCINKKIKIRKINYEKI
uniref:NADH dehydrogenase subunit 6 n=1 Tax=Torymus sp. ZJUH_2016035 TaxID=2491172 RepID=A0A3S8V1H6_9HYME|nr:NADH dehydrogenase subunit 6 [Torymus sp. ZJUH_2016035]